MSNDTQNVSSRLADDEFQVPNVPNMYIGVKSAIVAPVKMTAPRLVCNPNTSDIWAKEYLAVTIDSAGAVTKITAIDNAPLGTGTIHISLKTNSLWFYNSVSEDSGDSVSVYKNNAVTRTNSPKSVWDGIHSDPDTGEIWIAGGTYISGTHTSHIYSTSNETSWVNKKYNLVEEKLYNVLVHPITKDVYCAGRCIWRLPPYSSTWVKLPSNTDSSGGRARHITIDPVSGDVFFMNGEYLTQYAFNSNQIKQEYKLPNSYTTGWGSCIDLNGNLYIGVSGKQLLVLNLRTASFSTLPISNVIWLTTNVNTGIVYYTSSDTQNVHSLTPAFISHTIKK